MTVQERQRLIAELTCVLNGLRRAGYESEEVATAIVCVFEMNFPQTTYPSFNVSREREPLQHKLSKEG